MPRGEGRTLSPTDVAHHLACHHRTQLERRRLAGEQTFDFAPDARLEAMKVRGLEHERRYVESLRTAGKTLIDLRATKDPADTLAAMHKGADVIVQAPLGSPTFFGIADVLLRTHTPSHLGAYSYEPVDTKLAAETKAGALLQLLTYCELLHGMQGTTPGQFFVVTPLAPEPYRTADFAAYFRVIRDHLTAARTATPPPPTYPDPVPHCDVCSYWKHCENTRRADDHPSLIAGLQRTHTVELLRQGLSTVAEFAAAGALPAPPTRGRAETYERLAHQARLQVQARTTKQIPVERLPLEPGRGFGRLPEPSAGDVFLDFEGDPFVGQGGLEYLTGYTFVDDGTTHYECLWALDHAAEKQALETFLDFLDARRRAHPELHVYHFGDYEVAALRRLCARHDTRGTVLDEFLRGERFVNLHTVVREALRIGVEKYGLKELEPVIGYPRQFDLRAAGLARRDLELDLELGRRAQITDDLQQQVAAYNRDDCLATAQLRDWLEGQRAKAERDGNIIDRPQPRDSEPKEETRVREERVAALRVALEQIHPLLANLVGYFRRESKTTWWEYFHLRDLPRDEHMDEREMLAGLAYVRPVPRQGNQQRDRALFRFPRQECAAEDGDTLVFTVHDDPDTRSDRIGTSVPVDTIDLEAGEVTLLLPEDWPDIRPTALFRKPFIAPTNVEDALLALGDLVRDRGLEAAGHGPALDLLLRRPPRTRTRCSMQLAGESTVDALIRVCRELDGGVLPVQGPPGAGKTYTGARAIVALAQEGMRVGVIAVSHKVIDNLLAEVVRATGKAGVTVLHVDRDAGPAGIPRTKKNPEAVAALGKHTVVGGTTYFWTSLPEKQKLDCLFVDEAGQMSLAAVLAVARATKNLVLLGDPQQLEQPHKGTHPDGADIAALTHLIGPDRATLDDHQGLFLRETWRLHPSLCEFTSDLYYDGRLFAVAGNERQRIDGTGVVDGAGMFLLECPHEGNQASAPEEVEAIVQLVGRMLAAQPTWTDRNGKTAPLTAEHLLVIAPYNAQVSALRRALGSLGVTKVGTVDKFQGQEAPVVLYSCTSSTAADAPRGLGFLYDPHRLNVATSRARCAFVMVASPALFEPEVRTPEQMRQANGMCRFREVARRID
jgi:uncharacterized protein